MSQVTTHVLDTAQGRPAAGVPAILEGRSMGHGWKVLASGRTNADGRIADLLPPSRRLPKGIYRLIFDVGAYFRKAKVKAFYPIVTVTFRLEKGHYHVPLLLSPFGYSTYRGS